MLKAQTLTGKRKRSIDRQGDARKDRADAFFVGGNAVISWRALRSANTLLAQAQLYMWSKWTVYTIVVLRRCQRWRRHPQPVHGVVFTSRHPLLHDRKHFFQLVSGIYQFSRDRAIVTARLYLAIATILRAQNDLFGLIRQINHRKTPDAATLATRHPQSHATSPDDACSHSSATADPYVDGHVHD